MTDDGMNFQEAQREILRILDEELLPAPEFWIKGTDHLVKDDRQCYCLRGARVKAVGLYLDRRRGTAADDVNPADLRRPVRTVLRTVLEECIVGQPWGRRIEECSPFIETFFNDHEKTTFEDVKKVITCAREKAQ